MAGHPDPYDQIEFVRETALRKETLPTAPWRGLGHGVTDLLVVALCCLVFAVVVDAGRPLDPKGPPTALIARDLGTSPLGPPI